MAHHRKDKPSEDLQEFLKRNDQGHIFRFWGEMKEKRRAQFLEQLAEFDLPLLRKEVLRMRRPDAGDTTIRPATCIRYPHNTTEREFWNQAHARGESLLRAGKVAAITACGGLGSNLKFSHPKGMLPVTPVRNKSLFQVFAEKIRAAEIRCGRAFHWLLLTSPATHEETVKFLEANDFFGVRQAHVLVQGLLPTMALDGRLVLSSKDSVTMHPDGNGGLLQALWKSGLIEQLAKDGVEHLAYSQIDNPLAMPLDPHFIGFHHQRQAQMSCRCIQKDYAAESVNVFVETGGRLRVLEHGDLPTECIHLSDTSNNLRFGLADVAIYLFRLDFILSFCKDSHWSELPLHMVQRIVNYINEDGLLVRPTKPNAVRLERYISDLLQLAENSLLLEGHRQMIYSPIKNAVGRHSLETCRRDQIRLFARWICGGKTDVPVDADGFPPFAIEISPIFGDSEEEFLKKWAHLNPKPVICENFYLE
ncbi:MAG: UTP--glucose-1-phosphate uridylyltransferase [Puniceicoccales bacterium]|jgi:UDP-N-acetylglucosamine/UDP-N-acetylgalactosamine diphosphorylase|nr:UTP--glucose-1-phosphate uridylyltransferase [Puniceicoccales bacterium]